MQAESSRNLKWKCKVIDIQALAYLHGPYSYQSIRIYLHLAILLLYSNPTTIQRGASQRFQVQGQVLGANCRD